MQRIFTHRLIIVSTTFQSLPVSDHTFQIPTHTILGSASFLTLRIRRVKCEDPYSFFTTPGRRCSTSLRMRRPDPCSFNTVYRLRYGASLRGLRPNDFPYVFICIEMTKILVGSSSLTQPSFNRAWDRLC
jgi:hypothetical protein